MIKKLSFLSPTFFLLLSAVLAVILRLPSLFDPYWYVDEGVYLTGGQIIRKGLTLYRDFYDNKPPLIYFAAALAPDQFWWRLLGIVLALCAVYLFYRLAKLLLKNSRAVSVATVLFSLLWNLPYLEGHTVNAEHFFVPLGFLALLFALKKTGHLSRDLIFSGILFSLGFLFKFHSFFDLLSLAYFWLLLREPKLSFSYLFTTVKNLLLIGLGFAVPLILSVVYFFFRGELAGYWKAAFAGNFDYAVRWRPILPSFLMALGAETMKGRLLILAIILVGLFFLRKKFSPSALFISVWLLFNLFGTLLSGREYPHYLLTSVPPTVLLLSLLFFGLWRERGLALSFIGLVIGSILAFHFYFYPSLSYYSNFISLVRGQESRFTYAQNNFGWTTGRNLQIADYIKQRTVKTDRIFILSDQPHLYALTDRIPGVPYLFIFQMNDLHREEVAMKTLQENPPKMIVTFADEPRTLPGFTDLLASRYQLSTSINDAIVYELTD